MEINIRQVSSLEKVRCTDPLNMAETEEKLAMPGERFSYQLCMKAEGPLRAYVSVESELAGHIRLYQVKEVNMDCPVAEEIPQEDYITLEPGLMPDLLVPVSEIPAAEEGYPVPLAASVSTLWVKVDIPRDIRPGAYPVRIRITVRHYGGEPACVLSKTMNLEVIPAVLPPQKTIYTRWFYADCIAVAHNVEIYSEAHWRLIEKYLAAAADVGVNMILVPIHTPPLDTEVGTSRPCVQLVDIEKKGDTYTFSFERFRRFIDLCRKHHIIYFEMAHMFTQWGAEHAPNILVTENGKTDYLFGWHTDAASEEYSLFLKQYIRAVAEELEREGIIENTYFHISDEPSMETIDAYQRASDIIRPLIGKSKSFDALSHYEFYEKGLVECPITNVSDMSEFLGHDVPNQWVYYCCSPRRVFTNSFIAMPSYRTRILGFLLYKYDIKGFLHWGFNFYNSPRSLYPIDPYLTTSADKVFSSGDPFIVYPGREDAYPSIRGEVTYEAMQDVDVCAALEKKIGRDNVVKMIDEAAGGELRFDSYPRTKEYPERLRAKMIGLLKEGSEPENG